MLVIILIVLLAFGFEIDAKKNLNIKFDRSDKLINVNRRDFKSFYDQVIAASSRDPSCDQSDCNAFADSSVCDGFCPSESTLKSQAMTTTAKCLKTYPCTLSLWQIDQVRIPFAVDGYDGVCSLSGDQVTVTGGNDVSFDDPIYYGTCKNDFPNYEIYPYQTLTYSGLTVTCSPCSDDNSSSGGKGGIVYFLLCNVLSLGSIGFSYCLGNGGSSGSPFSASVTATQVYHAVFRNCFYTGLIDGNLVNATTSVRLGSGVPASYQAQVEAAVQFQFNDLDFVNAVLTNLALKAAYALYAVYYQTCDEANCGG